MMTSFEYLQGSSIECRYKSLEDIVLTHEIIVMFDWYMRDVLVIQDGRWWWYEVKERADCAQALPRRSCD